MGGSEYLKNLCEYAVAAKATDLHLCAGSKPKMRVNGGLEFIESAARKFNSC